MGKISILRSQFARYCIGASSTLVTADMLREANKRAGHHFFDADTMRFFGSRVAPYGYRARGKFRVYFVTSERRPRSDEPRLYTVRLMLASGKMGEIPGETFQGHRTLRSATRAAKRLAGVK